MNPKGPQQRAEEDEVPELLQEERPARGGLEMPFHYQVPIEF